MKPIYRPGPRAAAQGAPPIYFMQPVPGTGFKSGCLDLQPEVTAVNSEEERGLGALLALAVIRCGSSSDVPNVAYFLVTLKNDFLTRSPATSQMTTWPCSIK